MQMPDFLLIGAAKSGTTALFYYLSQHPEIFACPVREPNFFALEGKPLDFAGLGDQQTVGKNSVTTRDAYQQLFTAVRGGQIAGEVSPLYLYDLEAPNRIQKEIPNAKLIIVLRNPIDRAYASFLHLRRDNREPYKDFGNALNEEDTRIKANWEHLWHYTQMGFYAEQVSRYLDLFNKHQIGVWLYDDLKEDALAMVQSVFHFLDVDKDFQPDFSRRPNRSGVPRSAFVQRLMAGQGPVKRMLVRAMPEQLKGKLVTRVQSLNLSRPEMEASVRRRLLKTFQPDIEKLQGLIQRDLTHWLSD